MIPCLIAAALMAGGQQPTYKNPVLNAPGAADPAVIRYQGLYYLYPTLDCQGYDVFVSPDLVSWERKGKCYIDPRGGVWAPDVFHNDRGDGKLYLYYTVDNPRGGKLVGVAVADSPLGPFVDKAVLVEGAIDAHMFRDDDGKLYLYYVSLNGGFKIMVQPMADPVTRQGAATALLWPTEPWEKAHGHVTEGPWMVKHKGTLYLMYSGSGADGPDYGIGYATSKSPLGPFVKHPGNPIAHRGEGIFGPGHNCVVIGPDEKHWLVYHQKGTEKVDWDRFVAIDPLWFDEKGVMHTRLSRASSEPAPVKRKR